MSEDVQKQLAEMVQADKVVLFMKGNRHFPQCGFSATVVKILDSIIPAYKTVNVLSDPKIRDGVKAFSQWPTIPQLYVNGEFVGGCDIVREMYESGELQTLLGGAAGAAAAKPAAPATPPQIQLSEGAERAFRGALESPDDCIRLAIGPAFDVELTIEPAAPNDVIVQVAGLRLAMDNASASRANGLAIDFVAGDGGGFKIENPNAPPRVKSLSVRELKSMMDRGDDFQLYDVRTTTEREKAVIGQARHFDAEAQKHLATLDKMARIVFHCHHGGRSRAAAEQAVAAGYRNVYNVEGGIDAWSQEIDPKVARY